MLNISYGCGNTSRKRTIERKQGRINSEKSTTVILGGTLVSSVFDRDRGIHQAQHGVEQWKRATTVKTLRRRIYRNQRGLGGVYCIFTTQTTIKSVIGWEPGVWLPYSHFFTTVTMLLIRLRVSSDMSEST